MSTQTWAHHRARVAALSRDRAGDDPELIDARRDLRASRLADQIKAAVDAAPPLTDQQLDQLVLLLRPRPGGGRAA